MTTYSLALTVDTKQFIFNGSTSYGGVTLDAISTEFQDGFSQRKDSIFNYSDLYLPVNGSVTFRAQGPTASGIAEILYQISAMCEKSKKYQYDQYSLAPYLVVDGVYKALLLEASLELPSTMMRDLKDLKSITCTINYKRKGLVGTPSTITTNTNYALVAQSQGRKNSLKTTTLEPVVRVAAPTDITMKLFNQNNFFPSGFLLYTSNPSLLVTISGSKFYNQTGASSNPSQARIFNENASNAFNVYTTGVQTDGVLGFVTTSADQNRKIVSSGVWYIHNTNALAANGVNAFPSPVADVYATVKTFGSATYSVKVFGRNSNTGAYVETQAVTLSGINLPRPTYLGTLQSQGLMGDTQLFLEITPTSVASGVLQLDRMVIHGIPDESSRSVFISALEETTVPATASGNLLLRIINNYFPNNDQGLLITKPFITLLRDQGGSYVWNRSPTYFGDIGLMSRTIDIEMYASTPPSNMTVAVYFMATGGATATYSGYWIHMDRAGLETSAYFDIGTMQHPATILLPGG